MFNAQPMRKIGIVILWGAMFALATVAYAADTSTQFSIGSIIRGFELPQNDSQGKLKTKIWGEQALVISANQIKITGLKIEIYSAEGAVSTTITAPECTFWRLENRLTTDKVIEIRRQGMTISAKGMEWEMSDSRGTFRENVKVAIQPGSYSFEP